MSNDWLWTRSSQNSLFYVLARAGYIHLTDMIMWKVWHLHLEETELFIWFRQRGVFIISWASLAGPSVFVWSGSGEIGWGEEFLHLIAFAWLFEFPTYQKCTKPLCDNIPIKSAKGGRRGGRRHSPTSSVARIHYLKGSSTKKLLSPKSHVFDNSGVWYSSCWSKGPKNHLNLNILVSKIGVAAHLGPQKAAPWDLEERCLGTWRGGAGTLREQFRDLEGRVPQTSRGGAGFREAALFIVFFNFLPPPYTNNLDNISHFSTSN